MTMTADEAKNVIKREIPAEEYLTKSKGNLYICPFCGSGTGPHRTGAVKINGDNTIHCFSCGRHADVIELEKHRAGVGYIEALRRLAGRLHLDIERSPRAQQARAAAPAGPRQADRPGEGRARGPAEDPAPALPDMTGYYFSCARGLDAPEALAYLRARGISLSTAKEWGLGYDPEADPSGGGYSSPRIIIPVTPTHYIGRSIDPGAPYQKLNNKGAAPGIWGMDPTLNRPESIFCGPDPVYITEGVWDALAIIECGGHAVALNSTANADAFITRLEELRRETRAEIGAPVLLALDNDKAGETAARKIAAQLHDMGIRYGSIDICLGHKDPNEALQQERERFTAAIKDSLERYTRPDNGLDYIRLYMSEDIKKQGDDITTGFDELDKALGGGMNPALYVLAAISSLGKTTLAMHLADNMAAAGNDVLFFALEMSRLDMFSKSITRLVSEAEGMENITSRDIKRNRVPMATMTRAADLYTQKIGNRVSVIEGDFNLDVDGIRNYVRAYIERTGKKPIVFVDYLQVLQPPEGKYPTTKDATDSIVKGLRLISREFNLIVVAISSVNRANYRSKMTFEALKESGGIEYTADAVMALELSLISEESYNLLKTENEKTEMLNKAKRATPRRLKLVCLKNRGGLPTFELPMNYWPALERFESIKPLSEAGKALDAGAEKSRAMIAGGRRR